jgi:hypothetical protein
MPAKGDWRKPFKAALEMVNDSLIATHKLCDEQILRFARNDSIIQGGTIEIPKKNGRVFRLFKEHEQANVYSRAVSYINAQGKTRNRKPMRVFNRTKLFSRSGNTENSLTPAGAWNGNHLATRGEGEVDIIVNEKETYSIFKFTGDAEKALKGRNKIIPNAANKVGRFMKKILLSELDKRARSIS